jgi:kumamolisin
VLTGVGDRGVTDGVADGRRRVDFPASSPWVLSVGGTSLKSEGGRITLETVWRSDANSATGGGVSEKFGRPEWQSTVSVPNRDNGGSGRGIPDVVASADPALGVAIIVHGRTLVIGGDRGIGAAVGRSDRAYRPSPRPQRRLPEPPPLSRHWAGGVFRNIPKGDNGVASVTGYSAGPGWSPVAGWGSPDGIKLLKWLREHPNPPSDMKVDSVPCRLTSR